MTTQHPPLPAAILLLNIAHIGCFPVPLSSLFKGAIKTGLPSLPLNMPRGKGKSARPGPYSEMNQQEIDDWQALMRSQTMSHEEATRGEPWVTAIVEPSGSSSSDIPPGHWPAGRFTMAHPSWGANALAWTGSLATLTEALQATLPCRAPRANQDEPTHQRARFQAHSDEPPGNTDTPTHPTSSLPVSPSTWATEIKNEYKDLIQEEFENTKIMAEVAVMAALSNVAEGSTAGSLPNRLTYDWMPIRGAPEAPFKLDEHDSAIARSIDLSGEPPWAGPPPPKAGTWLPAPPGQDRIPHTSSSR